MKYQYNDGGRKRGGYKGHTSDCVLRATVIATGEHYRTVKKVMDKMCIDMTGGLVRSCNGGVPEPVSHKYLTERGWELVLTAGSYLKDVPKRGTYIAVLSRHDCAIINNTLHDTWRSDVSRRTKNGSPVMKGYYYKPTRSPVGLSVSHKLTRVENIRDLRSAGMTLDDAKKFVDSVYKDHPRGRHWD